jgi:hypothetical protein
VDRPVVRLGFDVAADRREVAGREDVRFTTGTRTCELIFRAWPNKPTAAREGASMTVTSAAVGGQAVRWQEVEAGAPAGVAGTLVRLPLRSCADAGQVLQARLTFRVRLAPGATERVGRSGTEVAWFGTAFPLLAWERERGWMTNPTVDAPGEMAGSEEFELAALEVVTPKGDAVLATGTPRGRVPGPRAGTTRHLFSAESVRDVAVTAGRLRVVERDVGRVRLRVGAPVDRRVSMVEWSDRIAVSMERLGRLLGPFPYPDLAVSVLPTVPSGLEFPGAILYGERVLRNRPYYLSHEVAHMYFYGLVGNNQGRDPWLDEAFASYAQAVADRDEGRYLRMKVPPAALGHLGQPMTYWARQPAGLYARGVYVQGALALIRARQVEGAAVFDAAVRGYLDANAHRVADPVDVRAAFADLPRARAVLREAGALS